MLDRQLRVKIKNWTVFLVAAVAIGFIAHRFMMRQAVTSHREMMANQFADEFIRYDQKAVTNGHDFIALNDGNLTAAINAIAQGAVIYVKGREERVGWFSELIPDQMNLLESRLAIENGRLARRNSDEN
ncbi:MAG: hypothetical protein AAGA96_19395 [Verrucomicrobiota bacterium]